MGGEVTLRDALEQVDSGNVTTRTKGLESLKHIFRNNRRYEGLSNDAFHRIYESLFNVAVSERSALLKAKTSTTRSAAEKRLSLCAANLRLAVDSGVECIKLKTLRSIVDHITQTLRTPHGSFCEPIALDYARSLKSLLAYLPHTEHLTRNDRARIVTFCCECIRAAEAEVTHSDATAGAEPNSTSATSNGLGYKSFRSSHKDSADSQGNHTVAKHVADEMVTCLALLTAVPNAAPGRSASDLLSTLINVIHSGSIGGSAHQDAFSAINNVLAWTRTEDTQLTMNMASSLLSLIKICWSIKSGNDAATGALREQLLVSLIYLRPYMFAGSRADHPAGLRTELSSAFEVMRDEYSKRDDRRLLLLDNLRLCTIDQAATTGILATATFSLQVGNAKLESSWATVYALASMANALSQPCTDMDATNGLGSDHLSSRPRKRQRLSDLFSDLLAASTTGPDGSRITALQIIAFLMQQKPLSESQAIQAVDTLSTSCAEDIPAIASWAMLAMASVASQTQASMPTLAGRWASVWQLAVRGMVNASTCRSACHLMRIILKIRLVEQAAITELVQTITSAIDLNGPPIFAESVASLLIEVVTVSRLSNPAASAVTAENILGWSLRGLRASDLDDKAYTGRHASSESHDVVELINCCLGQIVHGSCVSDIVPRGIVGQTWSKCSDQATLLDYLLLLPGTPNFQDRRLCCSDGQVSTSPSPSMVSCETMLLSHLVTEVDRAMVGWEHTLEDPKRGMSLDTFASFCKYCLTTTCIAFCTLFRDARRQKQLQEQAQKMLSLLAAFARSPESTQDQIDLMLVMCSTVCGNLRPERPRTSTSSCEQHICRCIAKAMSRKPDYIASDETAIQEDDMELDESQASRRSYRLAPSTAQAEGNTADAARYSLAGLRAIMTSYCTVSTIAHGGSPSGGQQSEATSARTVDYILSLTEKSMLLSSKVFSSLDRFGIHVDSDDCYRLLDHCAEQIMKSYPYERSDLALGAMLDMMSSFAPALTDVRNTALYELGVDMYNWYTSIALRGGVLSPDVQRRVASLLLRLCHVDTDYGRDDANDIPSVRTGLFKLIELGTVTVQYYLADRIPDIFNLFVLSNHTPMFEDLQGSLPADVEVLEGIAMRLLFLTKLASAWHSLLRQCTYYMFETAGRVPNSSRHAARCVGDLASSLNFKAPQQLFRLFAPQLLHTWLQHNPIAKIPFSIFNYSSLENLVEANKSEIIAQLLMTGNEAAMQFVAEALKTDVKALVISSFGKCEAYCIGWDISRPPPEGSGALTSESRLRKLVDDKEHYRLLLGEHFAAIMGQFYHSLQQDDVHDGWLGKRPHYGAAAKSLGEMKTFSYSDRTLPASQQPYFKNKFLCDQIERLCRRTGHEPTSPWDTSSLTVALRMLLGSIEEALGPLHTCLIIRKLRLLICMAGDVATSGMPLEILIHTLRPFLADGQCAEDVIGILQYSMQRGQQHLHANARFLFGTSISMVLQMRKRSGATLESTTQESQHRATVQKMRSFQTWLVSCLQRTPYVAGTRDAIAYGRITAALENISLPGNANKGTPESSLLLMILDDHSSLRSLVDRSDRTEAITLLSQNFQTPCDLTEDILEDDADCALYAESLSDVLSVPDLSEPFTAWTANALGRAYAATGKRPLCRSHRDYMRANDMSKQLTGSGRSLATIARLLSDLLMSKDRLDASLADLTLRNILVSFSSEDDMIAFEQMLPETAVPALKGGTQGYKPFVASHEVSQPLESTVLRTFLAPSEDTTLQNWAQAVSVALCQRASHEAVLPALVTALENSQTLALKLLPCIVHVLLAHENDTGSALRDQLSNSLMAHFANKADTFHHKQRYLIELLLYLREQQRTHESTHADRLNWLDIDWTVAAEAAAGCGMPTASLLFIESASSKLSQNTNGGRRSSVRASIIQLPIAEVPQELLLSIFKGVEEPDSFYGIEQPASLGSVLDRLDYEGDGYKSLMFRSAQTDTELRRNRGLGPLDGSGIVRSLSMLDLNSLTLALLSSGLGGTGSNAMLFDAARKLQQWDMPLPHGNADNIANSFAALQDLSRSNEHIDMRHKLRGTLLRHIKPVTGSDIRKDLSSEWFNTLASLAEIDETVCCTTMGALQSTWARMKQRDAWMVLGKYEDFHSIITNRHIMFSVLVQNKPLQERICVAPTESRRIEAESLLAVSRLALQHGRLQEALGAVSQCNALLAEKGSTIAEVGVPAKLQTASVLWALGEASASVKMLKDTYAASSREETSKGVTIGRSGLLAQLAHQLAEARLERSDEVLSNYLEPAIDQLHGRHEGKEAGKVFFEFASFCDKQLQSPDNLEDLERMSKLRERKAKDLAELEKLYKVAQGTKSAKEYGRDRDKAQAWYDIDDEDYNRLKSSRDRFMEQSLQNYLLALHASDEHDITILRFFALWLEDCDQTNANDIVTKLLPRVASWKFVVLLNQLMSRLEYTDTTFQKALRQLAIRLCSEHPYHSLHHLFASTRKPSGHDLAAISRYKIASSIQKMLSSDVKKRELLANVFHANMAYHDLAVERMEGFKIDTKIAVKDIPLASVLVQRVPSLRVPPVTMSLQLRPDGDYKNVPVIARFSSAISLMAGNSRPKKLSATASNGQTFPQLLKSGEDLRQDAIMEQVFGEVSKMLQNHKSTRQRNLQVRTYKVIPLSNNAGIIEFVAHSISFQSYLVPAHERYYPQDVKNGEARQRIHQAAGQSKEARVKAFQKLCDQLHPVMRHFFFERFKDPDEWFERRTAYTRTTATISILGYILGLGDRHCQNIMLDEKTGEVVHIDLGVAFEAGRVLPIPELVPFRLSRDVVDGMGITKTEGVFRRCCEFTLDALREDKDSIMTLLNVLRYDPLYTWTVSPLRAKRMQEESGRRNAAGADTVGGSSKKTESEAGEADRALSIVEKKLSKTLSTAATVNELIQQATDVRNLATLFNGWSAYF